MIAILDSPGTGKGPMTPLEFRQLKKQLALLRSQLDALEQMLQIHAPGQSLSVSQIQKVVAVDYKLPVKVMTAHKRGFEQECWARSVAIYLTRELMELSLAEIGRAFGNRDHTTIGCAVQRVQDRMEVEPRTKQDVQAIMDFLLNNAGKTLNRKP